jgi:lipid-A-disaccharide synthase
MAELPGILFTAFEPSGDALAAALIAQLKARGTGRPIYALGGPKMAASGAELIERTTDHAVMLTDAVGQALAHRQRLKRLKQWMAGHELAAVVPTDSPAANWSICQLTRRMRRQAKIVHLAAPQLWAWAPWRIGKLRRLTDHVLCLLPFEPAWFEQRGVRATFVGHPLYERCAAGVVEVKEDGAEGLSSEAGMRLALLPGSRVSEVKANWPTMLAAYERLRARHGGLRVAVAASDTHKAELLAALSPGGRLPAEMVVVTGGAQAVLRWAEAALVVSGTATLQSAAIGTPMVVLYEANRWSWHLAGRWLVRTRTFALPNLISEAMGLGRVVEELVPHFGQVDPVAAAVGRLLEDAGARQAQRRGFGAIAEVFERQTFGAAACEALLAEVARGESGDHAAKAQGGREGEGSRVER